MTNDLIDGYIRSGLVSDNPTRNFRKCDGCGDRYHQDELRTVNVDFDGAHWTLELCDQCKGDPDQA